MSQYRFQEAYLERLRQQNDYLRNHRFDYDNDPYFYSPPIYRYYRGGRYYQINEYAARILRQAVRYGYEEGFRLSEELKLIAYQRWDKGGSGDDVVVVANFLNQPQEGYVIGFPSAGTSKLRFNSDWQG